MAQKARARCAITRAPQGCVNQHEFVEGVDIRYVNPDKNQANLLRQAFHLYSNREYLVVSFATIFIYKGDRLAPDIASCPIGCEREFAHRMLVIRILGASPATRV
jgi:hypothetical protein